MITTRSLLSLETQRTRRTDDRSQMSEDRGRRSEVGGPTAEDRGRRTDDRGLPAFGGSEVGSLTELTRRRSLSYGAPSRDHRE